MMLSDFQLSGGDLVVEDGDLVKIECQEVVRQTVEVELNSHAGEWDLDTTFGVQYRDRILVKAPNLGVAKALLIAAVAKKTGVIRVTDAELEVDFLTRSMSGSIEAKTVWCDIAVVVEPDDILPIMTVSIVGPLGPLT